MLGICRGAQLLNRAFGGTVATDLSSFYEERPNRRSAFPAKEVELAPDSRLASILGPEPCRVNALHRHAVDRVGEELRIVARESNGVVQAIEGAGPAWVVGVQWHPEYLPQIPRQQRLFEALVRAAATERAGSDGDAQN